MEISTIIVIALLVVILVVVVVFNQKKQKIQTPNFDTEKLEQENKNLLLKNTSLETEKELLLSQKQEVEQQKREVEQEYKTSQEEKTALSQEIATLKADSINAEKQYNTLLSLKQEIEQEKKNLEQSYKVLQQEKNDLGQELATLKANSKNLEEQYNDYKQDFEKLQKSFEERIKNITNEILEDKTKKFQETNSKSINDILNPLKENIKEFKDKVESNMKEQSGLHSSLKQQIEDVMKQSTKISQDADNLAKALKGQNKTAGNWGENVLETILQNSGLIKNEHYFTQQNFKVENEEGETIKSIPDFLVKLPNSDGNENTIVIDSKVSLVAYEKYFNAESEEERSLALKDHIDSIRKHVYELKDKDYEKVIQGNIDFVMMFVPIESAYMLAMQNDPSLWQEAYQKKVVLISATNMISCLRLVADLWKINARNTSAQKIATEATKLYDKFIAFSENFVKIGEGIKTTQNAFNDAQKQLSSGKGNIVKKLETLKKYGIDPKKQLPAALQDYNDNEETEN